MIIDPIRAKYWHEILLPVPTFIFFLIHVAISTKLTLIRWRVASQKWINFYVIILSLVFLLFFLWLYFAWQGSLSLLYFYSPKKNLGGEKMLYKTIERNGQEVVVGLFSGKGVPRAEEMIVLSTLALERRKLEQKKE